MSLPVAEPRSPARTGRFLFAGLRMSVKTVAALCVTAVLMLTAGGFAGAFVANRSPGPASATPTPNAVDIGFAQAMIVHHQQAVTMCQLVQEKADKQVAGLAQVIESNQLLEIGNLQGFLHAWNASLVPTGPLMSWMSEPGGKLSRMSSAKPGNMPNGSAGDADGMPGMATQNELNKLGAATGARSGILFLQLMIRHHEGGLPMAEVAVQRAKVPQLRSLAQRMLFDQTQEIGQMTALLRGRGGRTLPPP